MKIKKIFLLLVICLSVTFVNAVSVLAVGNDDQLVKRVISVVYDDSYSMTKSGEYPDKQDDMYAKYALQNVIGFMNENDDLNVVRMSKKNEYATYAVKDNTIKQDSIDKVALWHTKNDYASETPFAAVETAISYLKDAKEKYGTSENVEYWLLVLTDGDFEGKPNDITEYFNNVRADMADVKYESVWVFIGDTTSRSFANSIKDIIGTHEIFSTNNDGIRKAVFDACEKIYGRTSLKEGNFTKVNDNTIKVDFPFPIGRAIIYEQDQNVELLSIKPSNGKNYTDFSKLEAVKTKAPSIKSKIIEMKDRTVLPSGELTLEFAEPIDTSENKFMLMLELAVGLELGVVNSEGTFETIPTKRYMEKETAEFAARPINLYDNSVIDLSAYVSNINATYDYEGNQNKMSFDGSDKVFKFAGNVHKQSNIYNATIDLPGYFRVKSNVCDIYVPDISPIIAKFSSNNVNVTKKYVKDYEKVDSIALKLDGIQGDEKAKLKFSDVPKGIQIRVNGTTYKNKELELRLYGNNKENNIEIYRNRDYESKEQINIGLLLNLTNESSDNLLQNHNFSFDIVPKERNIKLDIEKQVDFDKLNVNNAFGKNLLFVKPMIDGENITKEELKKAEIDFDAIKKLNVKHKIDEREDERGNKINGFYVSFAKSLNPFAKFNAAVDTDIAIKLTTVYNEVIKSEPIIVVVKSVPIWLLLIPILLLLALLIYIIGLIKKNRFDRKKYKMIVAENGRTIDASVITVLGLDFFVPYRAQKGTGYDLKLQAGDTKRNIIVLKENFKNDNLKFKYESDEVDRNRDLKMYEDTPLVVNDAETRSKRIYVYRDVTGDEGEDISKFIIKLGGGYEAGAQGRSPRNAGVSSENVSQGGRGGRRGSSVGTSSSYSANSSGSSESSGGRVSRRSRG